MNTVHTIAIIQMVAGAITIGISILFCLRSGALHLQKKEIRWLLTISLVFAGVYTLLIALWFTGILHADAFSGGIVLICSCLIASMAAFNIGMLKRLEEEVAQHCISRQKIDDLSLHDQLTHLYNRRGFISIVKQHLNRLRRLNKMAILFYAELNNLQMINEKSGYADGDRVLANVGTLMTATFRQADVLARIGDNEFMALLVDADVEDTEIIYDNFHTNLKHYNAKRSSPFKLSMSFGVSSHDPGTITSTQEIMQRASASITFKKKEENSRMPAGSQDPGRNFTLIISNMSRTRFPVDIKIHIDGELSVDEIFDTGMQNTWKPFYFNLPPGSHTIQAKSSKGKASLIQEFTIKDEHWASIEYCRDDAGARALPGTLSFHMHDVPLQHGFVRPMKTG